MNEIAQDKVKIGSPFVSIVAPVMRICSVCGHEECKYRCAKDEFWLCPECLKRLKKLLDKSTES